MKVEYKGIDITDSIEIYRCWLDQYAEIHGDTIKVIFRDRNKLWDVWSPQIGDEIRVYDEYADSGLQYVRGIYPSVGRYELDASSIPTSAELIRSAGWQQITKLQLARDIAKRHNLNLKTYGVTDHKFFYLRQENETDFIFLQKLCLLEGDAFLLYDNQLILYNEQYMEDSTASQTVEVSSDNQLEYMKEEEYTALSIRNDYFEYTLGDDMTRLKSVNVPVYIDSNGTAERYATNLLHHYNKMKKGGIFYTSPVADKYTAGSVINLKTDGYSSFDGKIFIYHIRHDLNKGKSKIFFRCVND